MNRPAGALLRGMLRPIPPLGAVAVLLAAALLLSTDGRAAAPPAVAACAPPMVLAPPRDQGILALTEDTARGRCEIAIQASNAPALQRQQQLMVVLTTAVCAASPALEPGPPGSFTATLRIPAACAGKTDDPVFDPDPPAWQLAPRPPPRYPPAAAAQALQGRVWVSMLVDAQGQVVAAILRRSSGHDVLDQAAIAEVRAWRFTAGTTHRPPGTLSLMVVPVNYILD